MTPLDDPDTSIDIHELKEIMDEDMDLIQECFTDFVKDWPLLYVQIKGAVLEKNSPMLEDTAHKLKGILKYLAAENAAQAAHSLESAGRGNDFKTIELKLDTLKNECQKVIEFIKNFSG